VADYRMSYQLSTGPPKAKDDLRDDEGLTDHLVVVSVMGTPGAPEAMSMAPIVLGPNGPEEFSAALAYHLACAFLVWIIENENVDMASRFKVAVEGAMQCLRRPILEGRDHG